MIFSMIASAMRRWRISVASSGVMGRARVLMGSSGTKRPAVCNSRAPAGMDYDLALFLRRGRSGFHRSARSTRSKIRAIGLGQWEVADLLHDFLPFLGVDPVNKLASVSLRLAGNIPVEIAADGVLCGQHVLHRGCNSRAVRIFLDIQMLDALPVSDAAVADAARVLRDSIDDCRGTRKGLRGRVVVSIFKDVFLEVDVGAGVVFAAVENDLLVAAADILPVLDGAGVNGLDLREREFSDGVGFIDVHREAIHGDRQFEDVLAALGLSIGLFGVFHRAGGLADIRGSVDEGRYARSGAAAGNLNGQAGILAHEDFGPALAKNNQCVRTLHSNVAAFRHQGHGASDQQRGSSQGQFRDFSHLLSSFVFVLKYGPQLFQQCYNRGAALELVDYVKLEALQPRLRRSAGGDMPVERATDQTGEGQLNVLIGLVEDFDAVLANVAVLA